MMSSFIAIIFAPLFVILSHYFEFKSVVLVYLIVACGFFIYSCIKRTSYKNIVLSGIYFVFLMLAYYLSSLNSVKYIPVTLSIIFLSFFIDSHFNKREMVLNFAKKFYPKKLTLDEMEYLKNGDAYWVFVMGVNTLIHLYVVNFTSDVVWAFYTSVGWYILFFTALISQIVYGKVYGVKMYSK